MTAINESFIKNVELIDNSPSSAGRKRFWRDLQYYMAERVFASILIGYKKKNTAGYYTTDILTIDTIVLPGECAEVSIKDNAGSIKFNSDNDFATFVHEVSHYYHFVKDSGIFTAPHLLNHKPVSFQGNAGVRKDLVIDIEYEAGYRALYLNDLYQLFPPDDRTILESNLSNMFSYIQVLNASDFKNCEPSVSIKRYNEWLKNTKSFSEISDYKTVI